MALAGYYDEVVTRAKGQGLPGDNLAQPRWCDFLLAVQGPVGPLQHVARVPDEGAAWAAAYATSMGAPGNSHLNTT